MIKQLYISIISVVLLVIAIVSSVYLLQTALYAFVFTGDQPLKSEFYPPAAPILDKANPLNEEVCTDTCALTETEKEEVRSWIASYADWKTTEPLRYDREGLITALSFFIVTIPLFVIHFRWLRKEYKDDSDPTQKKTIYTIYYYVVSLGTLIATVVFAALFINVVLRTWILPVEETSITTIESVAKNPEFKSIQTCTEVCGFSDEEKQLVSEYVEDLDTVQRTPYRTSWQNQMSVQVAGLFLLIPIFLYHWRTVRSFHSKKSS